MLKPKSMKRRDSVVFFLSMFFLLLYVSSHAENITISVGDSRSISSDFFGFNPSFLNAGSWQDDGLINAMRRSHGKHIRYPAGTFANYWDWKTGWFPNSDEVRNDYASKTTNTCTLADVKRVYDLTGVKPIWVVNMLLSNLDYQLEMLETAYKMGIPVERVELGNEFYLKGSTHYWEEGDYTHYFPTSQDYGEEATRWSRAIKQMFPGVKTAAVGCPLKTTDTDERKTGWNSGVSAMLEDVDALSYHFYTGAGLGSGSSLWGSQAQQEDQWEELLGEQGFNGVEKMLARPEYYMEDRIKPAINHPEGFDRWHTEFNMFDRCGPVRHTWAHGLFISQFLFYFLDNSDVDVATYHSFFWNCLFEAVYAGEDDLYGLLISPEWSTATEPYALEGAGRVMSLFAEASEEMTTANQLSFSPLPMVYDTEAPWEYAGLRGYTFSNGSEERYLIANFTSQTQTLDTSSYNGMYYRSELQAPERHITHTAVPIVQNGKMGNTYDMLAYSMLVFGTNDGPKLEVGKVSGVSNDEWTSITLDNSYISMVVVCCPNLDETTSASLVRVLNASSNCFYMRIDPAYEDSGTTPTDVTVHYMVVEEGVYNTTNHGVKMEAVKFTSTVTDEDYSWVGQSRSYSNSYTNPVVLGQVMSYNDSDWSSFWCYGDGDIPRKNPPDSDDLNMGKHVGEDSDTTRSNETIGYIVIEEGTGTIGDIAYEADLGSEIVEGISEDPPYSYSHNVSSPYVAIATQAQMSGMDGSWAVLYDENPLTSTQLHLAVVEDQMADSEQAHIEERVGWIVFGDDDAPTSRTDLVAESGDEKVSLDWGDNREKDLAGYNVYRSTTSGVSYSKINGSTLITNSACVDESLTNGVTYYYVVTAVDDNGNESDDSNEASVIPGDTTAPSAPTNLTAEGNYGKIELDWDDTTENDLAGYNVYRSTTQGGSYTKQAFDVTSSIYEDTLVQSYTKYYYVVRAVDFNSNESNNSSEDSAYPSSCKLQIGVVEDVGTSWTVVQLDYDYISKIVVCSPNYDKYDNPAVVRLRSAIGSGDTFQVSIDSASTDTVDTVDVHFIVAENATYTVADDGVKMEAKLVYSGPSTDHDESWVGWSRNYLNSYTNPVVIGQVASHQDSDWSVFWCSSDSATSPPSTSKLYVGKHVGEDSDTTRNFEYITYIVVEAGSGTIDGVDYEAGLISPRSVEGAVHNDAPYSHSLSGNLDTASTAIVSQAGMYGTNGSWAILYGSDAVSTTTLKVAVDEDMMGDEERYHSAECVSYIVFE